MDNRVDHRINVLNAGKTEIIDYDYIYGDLGPRHGKHLGSGGDSITAYMKIPEVVDVSWTTENDGKRHEVHVPLITLASPHDIEGKAVNIEINSTNLKVFIVKDLPNFQEKKRKIFEKETAD